MEMNLTEWGVPYGDRTASGLDWPGLFCYRARDGENVKRTQTLFLIQV